MTTYELSFANGVKRRFNNIELLGTADETGWIRVKTDDGVFVCTGVKVDNKRH